MVSVTFSSGQTFEVLSPLFFVFVLFCLGEKDKALSSYYEIIEI